MGRLAKASLVPGRKLLPSEELRVDAHVGARVRLRRKLLGLSQTALGDALGVAFQQVQKYERGTNRISSSTLYAIARVLEVPVAYFFEGLPGAAGEAAEPPPDDEADEARLLADPEALRLVSAYHAIGDAAMRRRFLTLVKAIAKSGDAEAL
ncbi:MAG TPA: helix-turn-helix transcriptional regulator [Alphaproteobacteria bacterium]|nr:helix-turn-helix transcriptional regulator [Alphaproteobacteria bacterium]